MVVFDGIRIAVDSSVVFPPERLVKPHALFSRCVVADQCSLSCVCANSVQSWRFSLTLSLIIRRQALRLRCFQPHHRQTGLKNCLRCSLHVFLFSGRPRPCVVSFFAKVWLCAKRSPLIPLCARPLASPLHNLLVAHGHLKGQCSMSRRCAPRGSLPQSIFLLGIAAQAHRVKLVDLRRRIHCLN